MTLAEAEHAAMLARKALTKLEEQWFIVRELGGSMPEEWWAVFGKAHWTVSNAQWAVCKAREATK